jgi:PKD repeat protein
LDWRDADGIGGALVADAGGPYLGTPSTPIQFDGRSTLSSGPGELSYSWDFGDGAQGTGQTPAHAYAQLGEYRVNLDVTDGQTTNSTWTTARIIDRAPPVARAGGPYAGFVGFSVFLDGRGSSDENGDPLTYSWVFGDYTAAKGEYAFHTYHAAGLYTVTLTVSDGVLTSSDETTARIDSRPQRPPIADAGGPYTGFAGVPLTLNGGGSSDPDGDALTYRWLFGDYGESTAPTTQHTYAAAGEYELILEVSDGMLTTSDATSATISEPVGGPPAALPGGPYQGVTGQIITFDGSGSADPDGDALAFEWSFGDGRFGAGPWTGHSYGSPGIYSVTLKISDGTYSRQSGTIATITAANRLGTARAFLRDGLDEVALGALGQYFFVQIEPQNGSFQLDEVDLTGVLLRCGGSAAVNGIRAVVPAALVGDTDGNGIEEVTAAFRPEDLRRLLGHVRRPIVAAMELEGFLWQGGTYKTTVRVSVIPSSGRFAPVVRPNPFNPQATVTYSTSKPGRVGAQLFDLNGRLVKTLLREKEMGAGSHQLELDARADNGGKLASGIYFLRITGPDGPIVTRISIAK